MRTVLLVILLTVNLIGAASAQPAPKLEAGLALTDPDVMEDLERRGFSLAGMFTPGWNRASPPATLRNDKLAELRGGLGTVLTLLKADIAAYRPVSVVRPGGTIVSGSRIDTSYFTSPFARFELVGVINRMDRAFLDDLDSQGQPAHCGEVRLIYRLAYKGQTPDGPIMSRLPVTFNLVLRARPPGEAVSCAEIARRWIDSGAKSRDLAWLSGPRSPIALIHPDQIDRLEINMQIMRWAASDAPRFGGHAEYLLRVFKWKLPSRVFERQKLEGQIDRERLADPEQLAALRRFLFTPANVRRLDAGTLVIPDQYLAYQAFSVAPGGASRSRNRPFDDLSPGADRIASDQKLLDVIREAEAAGGRLKNISSPAGFQRRLNDLTCTGCHQTRAIAGFHFTGADRREMRARMPINAIFVPASAHFYGEAPRRSRIVQAFRDRQPPDYLRSFSARPRTGLATGLVGTGFHNGWGATCYIPPANGMPDPSFEPWTCKKPSLKCVQPHKSASEPGMGVCMTAGPLAVGDPVEFGAVLATARHGIDEYHRFQPPPDIPYPFDHTVVPYKRNIEAAAHQGYNPEKQTGGFFGGMIRRLSCSNPALPSEAACTKIASSGFNQCIREGRNFDICMGFTTPAGLRRCDTATPCRDDYICVTSSIDRGRGACLPPYFLFQFRVDGHPRGFIGP